MKKNLISILGALGIGALALLPNENSAGNNFLRVLNTSTNNPSSQQNRIEYVQDGSYGFTTNYTKSLKIYDSQTTNTIVPVDANIDNTFTANLAYNTNTANNAENTLKFKFFNTNGVSLSSESTFPSNILITAQVSRGANIYTNFDVIKLVKDAASPSYDGAIKLPNISTNEENPYAVLKIKFTHKNSSTSQLENISISTNKANIGVNNVLPGSKVLLDYSTNLMNDAFHTIQTNYIAPTTENFNTTASTTFTNLDISGPQGFFRTKIE